MGGAATQSASVIAGLAGGLYAHSVTYVDHNTFTVLLATFAVAYPILGGTGTVFGTLIAVLFIQGFMIEGLRFLGDWRNILFGVLIILAMNFRPTGLFDGNTAKAIQRLFKARAANSVGDETNA